MVGRPIFASDLYSLGLTAIYLLTGQHPQTLDTDPGTGEILWQSHTTGISPHFAALLNKSIRTEISNRFFTAQEMLDALITIPSIGMRMPSNSVPAPIPAPIPTPPTAIASPPPVYNSPPMGAATEITPIPLIQQQPISTPTAPTGHDWKKAVIIGGAIGFCVMGSVLLFKSQIPGFSHSSQQADSSTQSPQPPPSTTAQASPSPPTAASPTPTVSPVPSPVQEQPTPIPPIPITDPRSNATIVGKTESKNVRSGPGTNYGVVQEVLKGDRVQILNTQQSGGYSWSQIYIPSTGAQGWIASQLVAADQSAPTATPLAPESPRPTPSTQPDQSTNATIIGEAGSKNVRSGPGTTYRVKHIAYPGDRVRILESQDVSGYTWYKVYFPESGAEGWLAAHLLKID
jgi:serine/threonine protein kinase, bacterial